MPEATLLMPRGDDPAELGEAISGRGWTLRPGTANDVLVLHGDWIARAGAGPEPWAIQRIMDTMRGHVIGFDVDAIGTWDSGLLVFISDLRRAARDHDITFDDSGLPDSARRLLALTTEEVAAPPEPRPLPLVVRVGGAVLSFGDEIIAIMTIVGETILRTVALSRGRARMRWADLLGCLYDAGFAALPVVTVINILVGCVLAFVGAVQLRRLGGEVFVAALVGVGMVREMASLMTAMVMAGRTGGAYAAHIATMQGSEEIDALRAIGIPIHDYLVLPRVIALTVMMPLLYLYGSAIGIFGGFVVSIAMLHGSASGFLHQININVAISQLVIGLLKSVSFGLLIAIAGCRTGLRAGRSAADVGQAATSAVVYSIVGIIVVDALFAICANALNV
jgi:phospholipid/cholesterol/gamma-HCH transport system permease protein